MRKPCQLSFMFALLTANPALADPLPVDPAVAYANDHGTVGVGYQQGWFGEGDTRLHYVEAGKGPLVIFYHGFPSNWFSWFDQMEALKGRYRVVAVDGLGAGLSGKPATLAPYRIDRLARQLDRLARHLNGGNRFVLVGHDWGAALSFAYAQAYPKRLNGVVGMSAPPYNLFLRLARDYPEQQRRSTYMQRFRSLSHEDLRQSGMAPRFAGQVYGQLRDQGDLTAAEATLFENSVGTPEAMNGGMDWYRANLLPFEAISVQNYWPKHNPKIDVPSLLIWGEEDRTFVPEFIDLMPEYASKLKVVRLAGVGHNTPIEQAARSTSEIVDFIDSLRLFRSRP